MSANLFPADRLIVIAAFRYALGRMTYVVEHVASWMIRHRDKLSDHDRDLVVREIDEAIRLKQIGMDCDADQWGRVRDAMAAGRRALDQAREGGP